MNKREADIMRDIQMAMSKLGHRLFRNNVGVGWVGKAIRTGKPVTVTLYPGDVLIKQARPFHAGLCDGSSDLIGWTKDGRFMAQEIKTENGRLSDVQISFLSAVKQSGGVAFCSRSVKQSIELLSKG